MSRVPGWASAEVHEAWLRYTDKLHAWYRRPNDKALRADVDRTKAAWQKACRDADRGKKTTAARPSVQRR